MSTEFIEESWVYGVELKPDFTGVIGEQVLQWRPPVTMDDGLTTQCVAAKMQKQCSLIPKNV